MTTRYFVTCDHCDTAAPQPDPNTLPDGWQHPTAPNKLTGKRYQAAIDLCPPCAERFPTWEKLKEKDPEWDL